MAHGHLIAVGVAKRGRILAGVVLDRFGRGLREVRDGKAQLREVRAARGVIAVIQKRAILAQAQVDSIARGNHACGALRAGQRRDGVRFAFGTLNIVRKIERRANRAQHEDEVMVLVPIGRGTGGAQCLGNLGHGSLVGGIAVLRDGRHAAAVVGDRRDDLAHLVGLGLDDNLMVAQVVSHAFIGVGGGHVVGRAIGKGGARKLDVGVGAFRRARTTTGVVGLTFLRLRVGGCLFLIAQARDAQRGKLVLGHGVERCLRVGVATNLDDLVERVGKLARHELRRRVVLKVVDINRDGHKIVHVLIGTNRGVVLGDAYRGARRHREASAVMVGRKPPAGILRSLDLFVVRAHAVGRVRLGHKLKGVVVDAGVIPVAAVDLLDGGERHGRVARKVVEHILLVGAIFVLGIHRGGVAVRLVALVVVLVIRVGRLRLSIARALPVVNGNARAAGLDLARTVGYWLAVFVEGRQIRPSALIVRELTGRKLLRLANHVGPGTAINLPLQLEGGAHDRRRAKAVPVLDNREARLGAVQEVGRFAHDKIGPRLGARALGQPLPLLHRVGKRRIPVVLGLGFKHAVAHILNHDAHVDLLARINHARIVGAAHRGGLDLADAVGKGAANVLERHGDGEAARADGAVAGNRTTVAVVQRNPGLAGACVRRHRSVLGNGLKLKGVAGGVRPLAAHEFLGNRHG